MKNFKLFLSFLLVVTFATAQKSVLIKYKPKVGSTLKTTMGMNMDMNMMIGEKEMLTKMEMGFVFLYNNLEREKDVNKIEMIFDRVTMKMSNPGMTGSYDSDIKNPTDPFGKKIAEGFTGVIKKPVEMKITTSGEFAEPFDLSKLFTNIPAVKAKELKEQMSNQFIHFPKKKVKIGESWTMNSSMNQIGTMELTYTLKAIEKKTILLDVKGKIISQNNKAMEVLTANIGGTATLDKKTGETLKSDMTMDLDMTVNVKGNPFKMNMKAIIDMAAVKI